MDFILLQLMDFIPAMMNFIVTYAESQGLSSPLDLVKIQLQADSGIVGPDGENCCF